MKDKNTPMRPCPFRPGEIVQLKSGGCPMTVTSSKFYPEENAYDIHVVFHRYNRKWLFFKEYDQYMNRESFPEEVLTKVD